MQIDRLDGIDLADVLEGVDMVDHILKGVDLIDYADNKKHDFPLVYMLET